MDALFIVVAELLVVPLILWGLIALELSVGVFASVFAVVMGRRSASEAASYSWRSVRRKLLWSLIFLSSGLLLADLVFFEEIVTLALGSADDREDLDVQFAYAEGSFMLGRIELHQLTLTGVRGGDEDPSARFSVTLDEVVIDIDTLALLSAGFAVEELSVDGVRGTLDRLRAGERRAAPDEDGPARAFSVERIHFGDVLVAVRDHTGPALREVEIVLTELDLGPVDREGAVFDLLYRSRGRGAIGGHEFTLTSETREGRPQTTLEVHDLPLSTLAAPLEKVAGVRARGEVDLTVVNQYGEGSSEPQVEIAVDLRFHGLEVEASAGATMGSKMMVKMAARELARRGDEFPLAFSVIVLRSELAGARSFADSGVIERVSDAIADALRAELSREPESADQDRNAD